MNAKETNNQAPGNGWEIGPAPRLAFNVRETCAAINVSQTSLWRLEKRGLIKPSRALRHKLYSRAEIERFLKESQ